MKILKSFVLLGVVLSGCGSDSKTNGTAQTASNQETYNNQCTYHKKVTNTETGNTQDFTGYVHMTSWVTVLSEDSETYQEKSFETDASGARLSGAKIEYAFGDTHRRHVNESVLETTDLSYDADSNFNRAGSKVYKNVDLWRNDSKTQRTLISRALNGELQKLDIVRTTQTIDEATWIATYRYPSPEQMSSGNQHVLEYSKSCVETYMAGRVE